MNEADALFGGRTKAGSACDRAVLDAIVTVVRRIDNYPALLIVACRKPLRIEPPFSPHKPVVLLEAKGRNKKK